MRLTVQTPFSQTQPTTSLHATNMSYQCYKFRARLLRISAWHELSRTARMVISNQEPEKLESGTGLLQSQQETDPEQTDCGTNLSRFGRALTSALPALRV